MVGEITENAVYAQRLKFGDVALLVCRPGQDHKAAPVGVVHQPLAKVVHAGVKRYGSGIGGNRG
jgi:hypothetical protein